MYVRMCVCMCIHTYVYMYVCLCGRTYVCMQVCTYIYMCVCTYVCTYVCVFVRVCMCVCTYVCVYVCMYICVYAFVYIRMLEPFHCSRYSNARNTRYRSSLYPLFQVKVVFMRLSQQPHTYLSLKKTFSESAVVRIHTVSSL